MKVAVGLSGGVDSAAAAVLLLEQGHEVIGITMKIWRDGRYRGGSGDACFGPGEKDDVESARLLCERLRIPYHAFDCADEYEKIVLDYFRSEYNTGGTPNPCVRCNSLMKFGVLPSLARRSGLDFDFFATGHYARTGFENGRHFLRTGTDPRKDQSYFLYRLRQDQLKSLLLPLGNLAKPEVREFVRRQGLAVAAKPDSQDFYAGDYAELLNKPDAWGNIVDESGKVLGRHRGYWHFTIGQRRGLGVSASEPLFVIGVEPCRNEVVVGKKDAAFSRRIIVRDCNWVSVPPPVEPFDAEVKVRSASGFEKIRVNPLPEGHLELSSADGIFAAAAGQSAVLYRDSLLLGGGIIRETYDAL